jgi:hypothetical protein
MSSGIVPGISCSFPPGDWRLQYCISPARITHYMGSIAATISMFAQNKLAFPPGPAYGPGVNSTYEYANENFIILSYLIEKLSSMSLQLYFRTKIFEPLGLSSTVFDPFGKAFQLVQSPAEEYYYFADLNVGPQPFAISSCSNTGFAASNIAIAHARGCLSLPFRSGSGSPKRQRWNNQARNPLICILLCSHSDAFIALCQTWYHPKEPYCTRSFALLMRHCHCHHTIAIFTFTTTLTYCHIQPQKPSPSNTTINSIAGEVVQQSVPQAQRHKASWPHIKRH